MLPLVLYDIPSKLPSNTWSPNPAKTIFVLGYKQLPYETVWVEYSDVTPKLKEDGAEPNTLPDGSKRYTVPVLRDPNTGAVITDSWAIAEYLDKTYPEKPVFPAGSKGLINAFDSAARSLSMGFYGFGFVRTAEILGDRSRGAFISTREAFLKCQYDDWSPEGPKRDAQWGIVEKNFYGNLKTWYERDEGKWLMGDTFSYADILLATYSQWFRRVLREDEWKRIAGLHDGKWEKLLVDAEKECNLA